MHNLYYLFISVNPSVYSSVTNLRVDINTIATLQVYIGGSDPVPCLVISIGTRMVQLS